MAKIVIIGAGGVGRVVAYKCAQLSSVFTSITLASRTISKCDLIAKDVQNDLGVQIETDQVDADVVEEVVELFHKHKPELVINVALPYQDLTIMEGCLKVGVNYLDTANYEPPEEAKFEYSWQWSYHDRFKEAGLTAILGCGFDPGVTSIFTAYAAKHHFDEIHFLDTEKEKIEFAISQNLDVFIDDLPRVCSKLVNDIPYVFCYGNMAPNGAISLSHWSGVRSSIT